MSGMLGVTAKRSGQIKLQISINLIAKADSPLPAQNKREN
jgi:hypothetical protein